MPSRSLTGTLRESTSASVLGRERAMTAAGIPWESGDEWRMAGDDKLVALVSLLRA